MRTLWDSVIARLQDGVDAGSLQPIQDREQVMRGQFGEMPMRAPFVFVYLEPGRTITIGGPTGLNEYTCTIFCGAAPEDSSPETVITAVEMAHRCADLIDGLGPQFPENPIAIDTVHADFAAVRLTAFLTDHE